MMTQPECVICPDAGAVASAAAERLVVWAADSVAAHGRFTVALSGGATPRALYHLLAQPPWNTGLPWAVTEVFFGDERAVPLGHADSNYHLAWEALLSLVPVPPTQIHRMPTDDPHPDAAARAYAQLLGARLPRDPQGWPQCDGVLLGMGADGHTASLFPGSPALREQQALVVTNSVPHTQTWRMTLTLPILNHARRVAFLVTGANKAQTVARVFHGDLRLPAAQVRPVHGTVVWFLDAAAASAL